MSVCTLPVTVDLVTITFAVIGGALLAIVVAMLVFVAWPAPRRQQRPRQIQWLTWRERQRMWREGGE